MLSYNEIKERKYIVLDGEPYEVLSSHVFRKQQRKPVNQTKLRNLKTGGMVEHTFHQADKVEEITLDRQTLIYLFSHPKNDEIWFAPENNRSERFMVSKQVAGNAIQFIKENQSVEVLMFNDEIIDIKIPIKIDLKVAEASPAVKGDTAQGATKIVVLETGFSVTTPLFIGIGDIIRINTETGEYVERVEKK